jgi:hypothetical protein
MVPSAQASCNACSRCAITGCTIQIDQLPVLSLSDFDLVILRRLAVVTHEDHDGILAQPVLLKPIHYLPHPVIDSGDHFCICLARQRQVFVSLVELCISLLGVMR